MKHVTARLRLITTAILCGLLLLPAHAAQALNAYTNLSILAPAGDAAGGSGNDHWFDQTATRNGQTYAVWIEDDTLGNWDTFLYSKSSNTTINLSDLLPSTFPGGFAQAAAVKVFSTGDPLVAWCEDNDVDTEDCFLYDGRTDTIIRPSLQGLGDVNGYNTWIDAFAIDEDDNYYLGYEHNGDRGGADLFLYRSETNSTIHLSGKLPVSEGTSTDGAWEPNYFKINQDGDAYFAFHSRTGSFTRTYLYDVAPDSLVGLSTLAGGVGNSGVGGSTSVSMEFLSNGKPLVLFLEDPTAIAGANARAFLYNHSSNSIQNLDALNPDIADYQYSYFYFPYKYNTFALRMQGDTPYAVWSCVTTATNTSNVIFYNGDAGTVRDISKLLPAPSDYAAWGEGLLGFDGEDGAPLVYFNEAVTTTSSQFYRYNAETNTVSSAVSGTARWADFMLLVDRPNDPPYFIIHINTPATERRIRVIDGETLAVTDLTSMTDPTGIMDSQRPVATYADRELIVAWIQDDAASHDQLFVYDGHDDIVSNFNEELHVPNGEGSGGEYEPFIYTDEDENAVLTWSSDIGLGGEGDRYLYTILASNPPLDPDDDDDEPSDPPADTGNSDDSQPNTQSPAAANSSGTQQPHTFTAQTTSESSDGSILPNISLDDLPEFTRGTGASLSLAEGQTLSFTTGKGSSEQVHTLTIQTVGDGYVDVLFGSTTVRIQLASKAGRDADSDGQDDLTLAVDSINTATKRATISFTRVSQSTPTPTTTTAPTQDASTDNGLPIWIYTIVAIILLSAASWIIARVRRNTKTRY